MANIDFALRTSAGSASLRRGTAADLRLLLALDEFWGDAAPEKAPSTRVNRATMMTTPTKKKVAVPQLQEFPRGPRLGHRSKLFYMYVVCK